MAGSDGSVFNTTACSTRSTCLQGQLSVRFVHFLCFYIHLFRCFSFYPEAFLTNLTVCMRLHDSFTKNKCNYWLTLSRKHCSCAKVRKNTQCAFCIQNLNYPTLSCSVSLLIEGTTTSSPMILRSTKYSAETWGYAGMHFPQIQKIKMLV